MAVEAATQIADASWFRCKVDDPNVHRKLASYASWLRAIHRPVNVADRTCERMYEAPVLHANAAAAVYLQRFGISRSRLNAIKSVVDTYCARIGKRRPMASFSISDADWSLKLRAKKTRKWLIGKMTDTEFDRLSPLALRDSAIARLGVTAIFAGDDDVVAERVYSNEILIDPREAQYGRPWQMLRVRRVARDVLADRYPEFKAQINIAPSSERQAWESGSDEDTRLLDMSGYVDVIEGWRLPTCAPDGDEDDKDPLYHDGRHVVAIATATFSCEEWTRPRFPFATVRYDQAVRGWFGRGLIYGGLAGIQETINNIVRDIEQNLAVTGKLIIFEQEQYASPVETLTGVRPFRLKYKGLRPPEFHVPEPVSNGQVEMLKFYLQQAFELPGVSQASATSRSSLGLNASGVALDTQYDIDSERFSQQEATYANYRLDAAQCYLDAAQEIARRQSKQKGKKRSRSLVSRYDRGGRIESFEFADVQMKDGDYKLQLEAVNFIPDTRAGRLSAIQELTKAGLIPQWMAGPLLGEEPDLAHANKILYADFHNLERIMEQLGDPDVPLGELMPEPLHNLAMAEVMARAYYNAAQSEIKTSDKLYEVVLQRFRDWIESLKALTDKASAQQAAAAPPGMPMGPGMGAGPPPGMGMPPGAGGPGLPPGMAPPNGVMPPGIIPPPPVMQ